MAAKAVPATASRWAKGKRALLRGIKTCFQDVVLILLLALIAGAVALYLVMRKPSGKAKKPGEAPKPKKKARAKRKK